MSILVRRPCSSELTAERSFACMLLPRAHGEVRLADYSQAMYISLTATPLLLFEPRGKERMDREQQALPRWQHLSDDQSVIVSTLRTGCDTLDGPKVP